MRSYIQKKNKYILILDKDKEEVCLCMLTSVRWPYFWRSEVIKCGDHYIYAESPEEQRDKYSNTRNLEILEEVMCNYCKTGWKKYW